MNYRTYPHISHLGHPLIADIFADEVLIEEKVDGCVDPETPLLTTSLEWVPAERIDTNTKLIGIVYQNKRWRLAPSSVTHLSRIKKPVCFVRTDKGCIRVSQDHPFLLAAHHSISGVKSIWKQARGLKKGMKIKYMRPWKQDLSWESGYLAGQYDGEGSLVRHGQDMCLSYTQKHSDSHYVRDILEQYDFKYLVDQRQRDPKWKLIDTFIIRGGWLEALRFIGTIGSPRLLAKFREKWQGMTTNSLDFAVVEAVHPGVGVEEVIGLSTSTQTYIADGFVSHNSQFNFGLDEKGGARFRSKGSEIYPETSDKLFKPAIAKVLAIKDKLKPGLFYRGETLFQPKHNTLAYSRVPQGNIILFDIDDGNGNFWGWEEKKREAEQLGIEVVPMLGRSKVIDVTGLVTELLLHESILGGTPIEGVVFKNYKKFGKDGKPLFGKYVSEKFKEKHGVEWKNKHQNSSDIISSLTNIYRHENRWLKSAQHLRDSGVLKQDPSDIGPLIKEVGQDICKECKEEIMELLWKWAWPKINRGAVKGLPQWYKEHLLKDAT